MSTIERWKQKADAYAAGWKAHFGVLPSVQNIALGLSVAQHETLCGDAWPGEHNWGAVQRRVPTAEEKAVIAAAGIVPSVKNVDAARIALEVAIKKGELHEPENCALHVDSSPGKGFYWVFFWAFDTDAEGAGLFVKIIAVNRASCRGILEAGGAPLDLARAMYASRYFEGFRKPGSFYLLVGGKWTEVAAGTEGAITGRELNVRDYGGALAKIQPGILAALQGWSYTPPTPVPSGAPPEEHTQEELDRAARLTKLSDDVMAGRDIGADALSRLLGDPRVDE